MDFGFCGIIDIVFVLFGLIVIIVGYKKGFLNKAVGMIGLFVGLAVAFAFCKQFAGWLKEMGWFYPSIFDHIKANVLELEIFKDLPVTNATVEDVLVAMGIPEFFANIFAENIAGNISVDQIAINISTFFTDLIMVVIAFVLLFVLVFFGAMILKLITYILRGNAIIKFVDGILGVALYFALYMIFIFALLAIVRVIEYQDFFRPVKDFLDVDMMLENENVFRLTKYLFEMNPVYAFFDIFL